jgi:hypothetical protein
MKKKLTIGVFLALAVVLVASIVGVGVADAGKPVGSVNATITATPDGITGNCTLSANIAWDNYGTWSFDYWWSVDKGSGFEPLYGARDHMDLKRHIDGDKVKFLPTDKFRECGNVYKFEVQLLKKNGNPVRGDSYASNVETCTCP